jgi:arylsulfatase A-like enzyme
LKDGSARPTDVMPTVLHALGIPISRELAGRPAVEMFSAAFAQRSPVREVSTYGSPAAGRAPRTGQPLDQEMIDRLRSLGYVR